MGVGVMLGDGVMLGVTVAEEVAVMVGVGLAVGAGVGVTVGGGVNVLLAPGDGMAPLLMEDRISCWRLHADKNNKLVDSKQTTRGNRDRC